MAGAPRLYLITPPVFEASLPDRVAALLSRFGSIASAAVVDTLWLNGAPGGRIDLAGELNTAVSLVVADGRITRIYAIRNPHKLARLDHEAALSR